ncbi:hypothetical protein ACQKWADRAFT_294567 [Trichoderma austrokoningii]
MMNRIRIHIHPQCGACNSLFLPEDHVVALVFHERSIRAYTTSAASHSRYKKFPELEEAFFCDEPANKNCFGSVESVTVHSDCFCLFGKTCSAKDKYKRLWVAGTSMYPWRDVAPLTLDPVLYAPTDILSSAAGFPKPFLPDIAGLIGSHLQPNHALLRFCKVIQLAQYLNSAESGNAVTHPLCEVLSWTRGTAAPILVGQGEAVNPRMRLTIDSRGIKSIERLSDTLEGSTALGLSLFSHAYIVESVEQLSEVGIEFSLGMSRLHVPISADVGIWNIPSPHALPSRPPLPPLPPLSSRSPLAHRTPPKLPLYRQFAVLDLDPKHTTGISFFMIGDKIGSIHGHTKRGSQALEAFQRLHGFHRRIPDWIYIPITANDKVIAIGTVRTKMQPAQIKYYMHPVVTYSIMLTMKSGTYFIGLSYARSRKQLKETVYKKPQSEDRHLTLIHHVPYRSRMSFIGADTVGEAVSAMEPQIDDPLGYAQNFYASLERVVRAQVFTETGTSVCRGILLEYEDGIKRTLGQCRLGFDSVRCYEYPTTFCCMTAKDSCVRPNKYEYSHVHVAFDSEHGLLVEEDVKWETYPMKGTLQFAYTNIQTAIKVHA